MLVVDLFHSFACLAFLPAHRPVSETADVFAVAVADYVRLTGLAAFAGCLSLLARLSEILIADDAEHSLPGSRDDSILCRLTLEVCLTSVGLR